MKAEAGSDKVIPYAMGSGIILILILLMHRDYPYVGHDYRYFIPRLIDTNLHLRLNGLTIQWYTPSFGGGLPAFPNPQHIQYSLVQWVSFLIGPWPAILVTTAWFSLAGFHYFYKFLHEKLELDWKSSTLGAMFFLGNGFYIEHMIVGQLGYQLFPVSAMILYAFFDKGNRVFIRSIVIALLLAVMIHQAGFYLIVILVFSFAITAPILYLNRPQIMDLKQLLLIAILAIFLCTALAASKMNAISAFMSHFPRHVSDSYDVGFLQGLTGILAQLLGVMVFVPIMTIGGQNTELLSGALSSVTGARYGIWEIDIGLSPVLIVILLAGIARFLTGIQMRGKQQLRFPHLGAYILLLVSVWVVIEFTLAKGLVYPLVRDLPILKSLHVNVRFTAALIVPLVVTGAFQFDRILANSGPQRFLAASFFTITALLSYFLLSADIHSREFKLVANPGYHPADPPRVLQISEIDDWDVFRERASSYRPYEPLFGYSLESFTPEIQPGSVYISEGGYFNMTNPASLVFPTINGVRLFERIKITEGDKLETFIQRGQPNWQIPMQQKILNAVSVVALMFCISMLCWPLVTGSRADRYDHSQAK